MASTVFDFIWKIVLGKVVKVGILRRIVGSRWDHGL